MKRLNFAIEQYKAITEDDDIMVIELYVVKEGMSKHGTYFSLNAIQEAMKSLNNKPVVCIWDKYIRDMTEHSRNDLDFEKMRAIGLIPEGNNAEIVEINGEKWVRCLAGIWKKYISVDLLELLRKKTEISLSMEIDILDYKVVEDGYGDIVKYKYDGICLLGSNYRPAIDGAEATVFKYSMPQEYAENANDYNDRFYSLINKKVDITEILEELVKTKNKTTNPKNKLYYSEIITNEFIFEKDLKKLLETTKNKIITDWCNKYADSKNEIGKDPDTNISSGDSSSATLYNNSLDLSKIDTPHRSIVDEDNTRKENSMKNVLTKKLSEHTSSEKFKYADNDDINVYCYCVESNKYFAIPYVNVEDNCTLDYEKLSEKLPEVSYVDDSIKVNFADVQEEKKEEEKEEKKEEPKEDMACKEKMAADEKKIAELNAKVVELAEENKNYAANENKRSFEDMCSTYSEFVTAPEKEKFIEELSNYSKFSEFEIVFNKFILEKIKVSDKFSTKINTENNSPIVVPVIPNQKTNTKKRFLDNY